jgi:hypothetical protein
MPISTALVGGFVGVFLGVAFQEIIVGKDYGAGQWQRASDKQFVSDEEGFVRWLSVPAFTGVAGYILTPSIHREVINISSNTSPLESVVVGGLAIILLYLFFTNYTLEN